MHDRRQAKVRVKRHASIGHSNGRKSHLTGKLAVGDLFPVADLRSHMAEAAADTAPKMPQKRFFRQRAHQNPLADHEFPQYVDARPGSAG